MKPGSILKLRPNLSRVAENQGSWLWVYEEKRGADYKFRAVGSGAPGVTSHPESVFENWETEV